MSNNDEPHYSSDPVQYGIAQESLDFMQGLSRQMETMIEADRVVALRELADLMLRNEVEQTMEAADRAITREPNDVIADAEDAAFRLPRALASNALQTSQALSLRQERQASQEASTSRNAKAPGRTDLSRARAAAFKRHMQSMYELTLHGPMREFLERQAPPDEPDTPSDQA